MPNFNVFPLNGVLQAMAAQTTSGTSAATSLSFCESYRFMLDVATMGGTTITLDVFLATSDDGGTTYYEFIHFPQVTTSGQGSQLTFRPFVGAGDTASFAALPNLTQGVDGASGSTGIATNGPFDPRYMKVRWVANSGVTTANFAVRWIGVAPGDNV